MNRSSLNLSQNAREGLTNSNCKVRAPSPRSERLEEAIKLTNNSSVVQYGYNEVRLLPEGTSERHFPK